MSVTKESNGFLLVSLLLTVFLVVTIGLIASQLVIANYRVAAVQFNATNAQFAADAGADYALDTLNEDHGWNGTAGELEIMNQNNTKVTFAATVSAGEDEFQKAITVTGRIYQPADAAQPKAERSYEIIASAVTSVGYGDASVVSGVGGLRMDGNSEILGGEVYVNGRIRMNGNSKIGQSDESASVKVAHQSCPVPPDSTYPRVCESSDADQPEPIDIRNNARIYGEVQATNQTDGSSMQNPGLVAGSPPPVDLPTYDRQAQKDAVTTTWSAAEAECGSQSEKSWPANLKIEGDVEISNNCDVAIPGDVWITGDLKMDSNSELQVADGVAEAPAIMIDGENGLHADNNVQFQENNNNVGLRILTYWSAASCTPECDDDDVTGPELYNGQEKTTILLESNLRARYTQFYARWSQLELRSNGEVGALAAQTIHLRSNASVTFDVSVSGSGGGPSIAAWIVESYKRVYQ